MMAMTKTGMIEVLAGIAVSLLLQKKLIVPMMYWWKIIANFIQICRKETHDLF